MPVYEFSCNPCEKKYTRILKMTDNINSQSCDVCNSQLNRVYSSNVSIQFNGSGFYSTDK